MTNATASASASTPTTTGTSCCTWNGPCGNLTTTCAGTDRKSTRLNSSHTVISYAVFCLAKKNVLCQTAPTGSRMSDVSMHTNENSDLLPASLSIADFCTDPGQAHGDAIFQIDAETISDH